MVLKAESLILRLPFFGFSSVTMAVDTAGVNLGLFWIATRTGSPDEDGGLVTADVEEAAFGMMYFLNPGTGVGFLLLRVSDMVVIMIFKVFTGF